MNGAGECGFARARNLRIGAVDHFDHIGIGHQAGWPTMRQRDDLHVQVPPSSCRLPAGFATTAG